MTNTSIDNEAIVKSVIHWFEQAVLGLNLCPFARRPYESNSIEFCLSTASDDEACLTDVYNNLDKLDSHPEIETLVIILSSHLVNFDDYNQFLDLVDGLLEQEGWTGIYQVASFHPDYCFSDCDIDARENWTNRSPYPLLHLIRESSLSAVIESHPDIDSIPLKNIQTMNDLSALQMSSIFGARYNNLD